MKRRTVKKRAVRRERRLCIALKHVRDQHNYAWRLRPTIVGFVTAMKTIGEYLGIGFGSGTVVKEGGEDGR